MLKAAFAVLEQGPLVDLRGISFPHLASLLRHGMPIPIHNGQGCLFATKIVEDSKIVGRTIADIFDQFPDLVAVAVIRDQQVQLPRGGTQLEGEDQLLIAGGATKTIETFQQLAGDDSQ